MDSRVHGNDKLQSVLWPLKELPDDDIFSYLNTRDVLTTRLQQHLKILKDFAESKEPTWYIENKSQKYK